tara:strand:- start:523 stop:744 length:222 start_codon:yes stop_codon:yes gene_type:complete
MNFIVVLVISVILTISVYLIHNKILKKETDKLTLVKLVGLGVLLSGLNYLIFANSNTEFTKLLGDFETGTPDF